MVGKSARYPFKSSIKKAIKKKLVLVDKKPGTTATFINGGEEIVICSDEKEGSSKKFIYPLEVIYEDNFLAVINKPAGILVSGNTFKTIDNALVQNLKISPASDACRPRPVHRLDYETTGVLLVGKTKQAIVFLNQLFETKQVEKKYFAIAIGKMKTTEGFIESEIDQKASSSYFRIIQTLYSKRFIHLNLLELIPKTGRRHQLRKHLAEIGHPILGDQKYGTERLILKGKGLHLHSSSLQLEHPFTKKSLYVEAQLPKKFQKIVTS